MAMDFVTMMQKLAQRVRILEVRNPLENASVDRGGLYIRSNEGLIVEGSEKVSGWLVVTGTLKGTGTFDWSGDLLLSGSQHVTGPTVFDGSLTINGPMKVVGPWELIGSGKIRGDVEVLGNVDVKSPGRIRIDGGSSPATLENGAMTFGTGGKVEADVTNGGVRVGVGINRFYAGSGITALQFETKSFSMTPSGFHLNGIDDQTTTDGLSWLAVDENGTLYKVAQSVGGPLGGPLTWPFPPATVTSEFGPRESPGGVGSTDHQGIDFGVAEGTDIPASAAGTVELAGWNGGYGNCVILDHGNGLKTLYAHMQSTPAVSLGAHVGKRQTLGQIGSTGDSTGPHLHFEVHVNGIAVNPRSKLPTQL